MIEQLFNSVLPSIEHFQLLGYWVAFFAAFLETALVVGLLLPGSTLLLLLGALSAAGHLDFAGVLWFAVAGAILGDNLNFWLGGRYGRAWTRDGVWLLKPEHFEQARRFFDAHGAKSVFLGRFIPSIKEIAPFVAGTLGMRRYTFFFWNVLGGIGWGLQWIGGGYLFGQSLTLAEAWMSRLGMALFALLLLWLLLWLLKRAVLRHGPAILRLTVSLSRSIARAIRSNPYVARFVRRHPRLIRFLTNRVDRSHFHGLPLTLLVLAFGYLLALFAGIVEDVVTADSVVALDHAVAQLVAKFRAPELIPPLIWITALGRGSVIALLLAVAWAILWLLRRPWLTVPLLVSSLGASAFTWLGKFAFHRPRPGESVLLETTYSFPSGHATIAVAFYGFVGYVLAHSARRWTTKVNLSFLAGVLILLIGLSRILLGAHYLSDVWAGYLVGALWLILAISLSEWLTVKGKLVWQAPVEPRRYWVAAGLSAIALAGYAVLPLDWQPPRQPAAPAQTVELDRPITDFLLRRHLAYTETLLGEAGQPLGLALVARDTDTLLSSLKAAGWLKVDRIDLHNMTRLARRGLDYTTAPLAPAFWNGQINDFALETPIHGTGAKSVATLRLWPTPYRIGKDMLFVGIAREYVGIRWGLLHQISPDVDAATAFLVQSLKQTGQVRDSCRTPFVRPMIGRYLLGSAFFTHGDLSLIDFTQSTERALVCVRQGASP